MKKGFTLIELSIVLVVIGLLIGGILIGQSLIESARMTKLVREMQQYTIAFRLYKERFRYLPGDTPASIIPAPPTGYQYPHLLGNGMIDHWHVGRQIWWQLDASHIMRFESMGIDRSQYLLSNNTIGIGRPKLSFKSLKGHPLSFVHHNWAGVMNLNLIPDNDRTFSALEAYQFDKKLDDGYMLSGDVTHWNGGGTGYTVPPSNYYHCSMNPTNIYGFSRQEPAGCITYIKFGNWIK